LAAFTLAEPNRAKKTDGLTVCELFGSACIKALRKMLVKSIPGAYPIRNCLAIKEFFSIF